MAKHETIRIVQTNLLEHPAVQAWRELSLPLPSRNQRISEYPREHTSTNQRISEEAHRSIAESLQLGRVEPERIEILKGKLPNQTRKIKRLVCRLVGLGPAGSAVIGKRCGRLNAVIESTIYEDILPSLPIPSLNYYGLVEEANGEFCWLFLEDAGEEAYSARLAEHRALSAQWLGLMHTSAAQVAAPAGLPDRGPKHYLKRLRFVRDAILGHLVNPALQADGLVLLEAIVCQCDILESHWDQVEEVCKGIPQTLVHGDFVVKNLRVRSSQAGMVLLPFDWGEAGWGVPAIDLMDVDVAAYWSVVHAHWPWLGVQTIQRLAIVGKIFRCLDAIYWELPDFKYEWLKKPISCMKIYRSWLADAIRAAEWED